MDKLGNNWSKQTILEADTGRAYNKYFYKRRPAIRVVIDSPKARALAGYTLIEKDLRSARIWTETIKSLLEADSVAVKAKGSSKTHHDRETYNQIKGFFVAALTFYAKCFSSCEGRKIKLEKKNLNEEFHEDHDSVMEMRHNFAAHSGSSQFESVQVVIALDSNRKKGTTPYFCRELKQPDSYTLKDMDKILRLLEHAKSFADTKIEVLTEKVLRDDIIPKGADYWYSKA